MKKAGRNPADIEITNTVERALPTTDEESEQWLEGLRHRVEIGITHFVLDFSSRARAARVIFLPAWM